MKRTTPGLLGPSVDWLTNDWQSPPIQPPAQPEEGKKRWTASDLFAEGEAKTQQVNAEVTKRRAAGIGRDQATGIGAAIGAIIGGVAAPAGYPMNTFPALAAVQSQVATTLAQDRETSALAQSALRDYHQAVYQAARLNTISEGYERRAQATERAAASKAGAEKPTLVVDEVTGTVYEHGPSGWTRAVDANGKPLVARKRATGQGYTIDDRMRLLHEQQKEGRWREYGDRNTEYQKRMTQLQDELRQVQNEIAKHRANSGNPNDPATWGLSADETKDTREQRTRRATLRRLWQQSKSLGDNLRALKEQWDKDKAAVERANEQALPALYDDLDAVWGK